MSKKGKIVVTDEARFDLSAYEWDDYRFSDILVSNNPINTDQAMDISRFLREEINRMDNYVITMPVIEKLIEKKLLEFGLAKPSPVRLDKTIFVKNGLVLSDNARSVLERRYLKKDDDGRVVETAVQMFLRVARHIAKAEAHYGDGSARPVMEKRFFRMMSEFKFLPNSPTLMNAGRKLGQLAACFVLPVEDSMEGIFETLKNAALIHKSGGGTGFSFSRLRPKKSRVGTTGGVASGPVSFMRVFNTATEQVKQGGTRRGANIAILRADHPDIMEFIHSKNNPGELNNFNISVGMTAAFMEAVKADTTYDLIDPHTQTQTGSLNARKVYRALVQQAWRNGDPGIVFLDRLNQDNPTPAIGEIESTNPCVTGDAFVLTKQGPRQIRDILNQPTQLALNGHLVATHHQGFFSKGVKAVFQLKTREGYSLRLTSDHKIKRAASVSRKRVVEEWVSADQLQVGDKLILNNHRTFEGWPGRFGKAEGYLLGLLVGDGVLKNDKAVISTWTPRQTVNGQPITAGAAGVMQMAEIYARSLPHRSDFEGWRVVSGRDEHRLCLGHIKWVAEELGMAPGNKRVTKAMETCSSDFYREFLSGFFDSDGSVQGNQSKGGSIRLAQSDLNNLRAVQRMLLRLGVFSVIYRERRPAGKAYLPDGKGGERFYATKSQHELVISKDNIRIFAERIGFKDTEKQAKLDILLKSYKRTLNRERFLATFESLVYEGEEAVFDVQVPGVNAFDANGFYVHNCGEQPLLPGEACTLGSINLLKFVVEDGEEPTIDFDGLRDTIHCAVRFLDNTIDFDGLRDTIHCAVRFLDNTIDVSEYPIPEIKRMVRGNRKIGLGLMGFADMLYHLKIPYNSNEALEIAEKMMRFIQSEARLASKALASERGVFDNFDRSVFKNRTESNYRNATTTTIAPTGTLSIIADCSSGIEPLFALSFVRNVMDNDKLRQVNPCFEKVARERGFYSDELMDAIAHKGSIQDMSIIPEDVRRIFVTAHDISPEWHIRMQAAFQKYTDNAVSKTVNMPHDATVEDVLKVYDMAYELGCKGITIYRDGSKINQVLSYGKATPAETPFQTAVKERPEVLEGFTSKIRTGMGQLYVTVTEFDGRPFEVFATIGKSGRSTTAKTEAIGRLISLALRAGVRVEKIIEQLEGIGGEYPIFRQDGMVLSIPDAISRVLAQKYGKNGAAKKQNGLNKAVCPECKQAITFEEGCLTCHYCGFSKCG